LTTTPRLRRHIAKWPASARGTDGKMSRLLPLTETRLGREDRTSVLSLKEDA
jgi:hypothetical protein